MKMRFHVTDIQATERGVLNAGGVQTRMPVKLVRLDAEAPAIAKLERVCPADDETRVGDVYELEISGPLPPPPSKKAPAPDA